MTGGEVLGGAAAGAGRAALGGNAEDKKVLAAAAIETEAGKAAAEFHGRRMAAREQALLRLMTPIYWALGVRREYFRTRFVEDLGEKTADIPEENLTSPPTYLAGPVIENLGYSVDEAALKDMYLNLLAAAADNRRTDAHPSFADKIKQLAPEEASVLREVLTTATGNSFPVIAVHYMRIGEQSYNFGPRHILPLRDPDGSPVVHETLDLWVENWERLGLVETNYDTHEVNDDDATADPYDWADSWPVVERCRENPQEGHVVRLQKGILFITATGTRFADVVFGASSSRAAS